MTRQLPPTMTQAQADARRAGVVRTAVVFGVIAAAIYVGFILMGVVGR